MPYSTSLIYKYWENSGCNEDSLRKFTVYELSNELAQLGCIKSGPKWQLVPRLHNEYKALREKNPESATIEKLIEVIDEPAYWTEQKEQVMTSQQATTEWTEQKLQVAPTSSVSQAQLRKQEEDDDVMIIENKPNRLDQGMKSLVSQLFSVLESEVYYEHEFAIGGYIDALPIINVQHQWILKYPCDQEACQHFVTYCHQVPPAQASAESISPELRTTWHVDTNQFEIVSAEWNKWCNDSRSSALLDIIRKKLTPHCSFITAKLDKLVVYAKGNMIKSHYDMNQSMQNFGKLVVVLPSVYQGGDILLRHQHREKKFNFSLLDPKQKSHVMRCGWIAYYNDCEHEIKELTQGHQVTLHYNLYFGEGTIHSSLAQETELLGRLKRILNQMFHSPIFQQPDAARLGLGILCENSYLLDNPSADELRGKDKSLYQVLQSVRDHNYDIVIAPVQIVASGIVRSGTSFMQTHMLHHLNAKKTYEIYSHAANEASTDVNIYIDRHKFQYKPISEWDQELQKVSLLNRIEYDKRLEEDTSVYGPVLFLNDMNTLCFKVNVFTDGQSRVDENNVQYKLQYYCTAMIITPIQYKDKVKVLVGKIQK